MFKFLKPKPKKKLTDYYDLKDRYRYQESKKSWLSGIGGIFSFRGLTFGKAILKIIILLYVAVTLVAIAVIVYALSLIKTLPDVRTLYSYQYELPTLIYDRDNQPIYEYFDKRRILLSYDEIPQLIKDTVVASEDSRFYSHFGIDFIRILKAFAVDIIEFNLSQGASTITQQTAKLYFLSPEKTIKRKLTEILLALKLERAFSKDQILGFYLNKAFFGRQSYGIGAAAKSYFSKDAKELSISESATLIGLLPAPSRYSPTVNIEVATERRDIVLNLMKRHNYINEDEYHEAITQPIVLNLSRHDFGENTSFYTEEVRRYLVNAYGQDQVIQGGLKVQTTMDLALQKVAQQALRKGLMTIEKRHGYRGPLANFNNITADELETYENLLLDNDYSIDNPVVGKVVYTSQDKALVTLSEGIWGIVYLSDSLWAKPYDPEYLFNPDEPLTDLRDAVKIGDYLELKVTATLESEEYPELSLNQLEEDDLILKVLLHPTPAHNGALLAMDLTNGHVLAMSGGFSFGKSQFNRVTQSRRQPGSAFKPFVYLTALNEGYTAASILEDTPILFENLSAGHAWIPKNYGQNFSGYLSLRNSLVFSKNIPTVKLAYDIGLSNLLTTVANLKIDTKDIPSNLSASLGSGSVSLWEMVRAFSAFANNGNLLEPIYVLRVLDNNGQMLENNEPIMIQEAIPPTSAFILSDMLYDVNIRGTGRASKILETYSAGKTGTTNDNSNAWYIGYIPGIICGVYIGNDDFSVSLGELETGSRAALPIWIDFMQAAKEFVGPGVVNVPYGITQALIVSKTGKLYCGDDSGDSELTHLEYFKNGTEPTECDPLKLIKDESLVENPFIIEDATEEVAPPPAVIDEGLAEGDEL